MNRLLSAVTAVFLLLTMPSVLLAHTEDATAQNEINLARLADGAQIQCITPDGRVELITAEPRAGSAVVLRDETLSCPLQEGITTFVIKLPTTTLLDRFTFVNENAAASGELKISVSNYQLPAVSPKWVEVDGNILFSRKRLFNLSMVGVEARYVKLSFHVQNGGRLSGLALYGSETLPAPAEGPRHAAHSAKGRVVYISSGDRSSSGRVLDENTQSAHAFALSDRRPTVIVELAESHRSRRLTAIYKTPRAGRVDVYLLNDMGKSAADLKYLRPDATAVHENSDERASLDFEAGESRYVAVRFTATASGARGAGAAAGPFEIIEITALGDGPAGALEAPDVYDDVSATLFPGEGGIDISSRLGPNAVPPVVAPVSP